MRFYDSFGEGHGINVGHPAIGIGETDDVVALLQVNVDCNCLALTPIAGRHGDGLYFLTVDGNIHLSLIA